MAREATRKVETSTTLLDAAAHRLDRYGAGRRMEFATSTPDVIADAMVDALRAPTQFKPIEADGAARAARMLADLI